MSFKHRAILLVQWAIKNDHLELFAVQTNSLIFGKFLDPIRRANINVDHFFTVFKSYFKWLSLILKRNMSGKELPDLNIDFFLWNTFFFLFAMFFDKSFEKGYYLESVLSHNQDLRNSVSVNTFTGFGSHFVE